MLHVCMYSWQLPPQNKILDETMARNRESGLVKEVNNMVVQGHMTLLEQRGGLIIGWSV